MKKRLISCAVLAVLLLSSLRGVGGVRAEETDDAAFQNDVHTLAVLGILPDGDLRPDGTVSRGEFISMAASLANLTAAGEVQFNDLDESSEWYSGVAAAASGGLVRGDGDGNILPDDPISAYEAGVILLRVLGYTGAGVEPFTDVNSLISATGVLNGTNDMTRRNVISILVSMLDKETVHASYGGDTTYYEQSGLTVLEDYHSIYQVAGIVNAVGEMCINGLSTVREGEALIGDQIYTIGEVNADDFIGREVSGYYQHDDRTGTSTLLLLEDRSNRVLEVAAEDIASYENNTLEYYDGETLRRASTDVNLDVLYNRRCNTEFIPADMEIENGTVTLIDNDTDGAYDIAVIMTYQTYMVDSVDTYNQMVYLKYFDTEYKLDFNASDKTVEFVNSAGYDVDIREIMIGDVICVYESKDSSYIHAVLCVQDISGTISATERNENEVFVTIGEEEYRVSASCIAYQSNLLKTGQAGIFVLDIDGCIAYIKNSSTSEQYAYVIAASKVGAFGEVQMKLLLEDGSISVVKAGNRCTFNNVSYTSAERLWEAMNAEGSFGHQLVLCRINSENQVTAVTTAGGGGTENPFEMYYTDYTYTNGIPTANDDGLYHYYKTTGVIGMKVAVDSGTVVMIVPNDPGVTDEKQYVVDPTYLVQDQEYYVEAYRTDPESYTASAIVIYDDVTSDYSITDRNVPICVLDYVGSTLDEEGSETYSMHLLENGQESTYNTVDADILQNVYGEYHPTRGDVLRYETNNDGLINKLQLIYSAERDVMVADSSVTNADSTNRYVQFRVWDAYVFYRWGSFIILTRAMPAGQTDYDPSFMELHSTQGVNVVICDKEENIVYNGTADDLVGYKNTNGAECSRIIAYERYGEGRTIVVYR